MTPEDALSLFATTKPRSTPEPGATAEAGAKAQAGSTIEPLGKGLIHKTYVVSLDGGEPRFVLQRINTDVFTDPGAIEHNLEVVCKALEDRAASRGDDPVRAVLRFVRTPEGTRMARDQEGNVWRLSHYVPDSVTVDVIRDEATAYGAALRFGRFLSDLWDIEPGAVKPTIPDFHNTPARIAALRRACGSPEVDPARLDRSREAIRDVEARAHDLGRIETGIARGSLSNHVCHFDTKISNLLLDRTTGSPLCVIDLDTIGPGSPLLDVGDLLRSGAATASEEERDPSVVSVKVEYAAAIVEGFLSVLADRLNAIERELLPFGGWLITMEQAIRYLTDYLQGDRYYGANYPEHNLTRAMNQLALAMSMEKSLPIPGLHISD